MKSSGSSKRKLLPFVPDVPYHIQIVFIITFGWIWSTALQDDYLAPLPADEQKALEITVSTFDYFLAINHIFAEEKLVERHLVLHLLHVCVRVPAADAS